MTKERSEKSDKNQSQEKKTLVWEWMVGAVGLILVTCAIGFMLYRAVTEETTPPVISIEVDSVTQAEKGFLVQFTVRNAGNQTAADLNIEGELKSGEQTVETSTASVIYAPANSNRKGGLFFTKNPYDFELRLRPTGYVVP